MSEAPSLVDVSAGVLLRPDGSFFLASRPPGKVYAGYWEFPGGKVEPGERPYQALCRELREELGIEVRQAYPWLTQVFTYPHATVRLRFFQVTDWSGEPHPHEGQEFAWQPAGQLSVSPMLPANTPVLRALTLPRWYAVSNAAELGPEPFLGHLRAALERGLRLLQVRETQMSDSELLDLTRRVVKLARPYGARVVLNGAVELVRAAGADGIHVSSARLAQLEQRPDVPLVGASCHSLAELQRAAQFGLDYALLGSVLPTRSHPGARILGWQVFADQLAGGLSVPVYALGGLTLNDLETARQHGAHGVALLRGSWQ